MGARPPHYEIANDERDEWKNYMNHGFVFLHSKSKCQAYKNRLLIDKTAMATEYKKRKNKKINSQFIPIFFFLLRFRVFFIVWCRVLCRFWRIFFSFIRSQAFLSLVTRSKWIEVRRKKAFISSNAHWSSTLLRFMLLVLITSSFFCRLLFAEMNEEKKLKFMSISNKSHSSIALLYAAE